MIKQTLRLISKWFTEDSHDLQKEKIKLQGKDLDLSSDDTYSLDEDDGSDDEDGDDFDIRLLDIENDD